MTHVRELQTARQSYFGAPSALKQPVVTRNSSALCDKKLVAIRCIIACDIAPGHHDKSSLRFAGAAFLPAMALFGATATKDTLYDYTVKDAGRLVRAPALLEAFPHAVCLPVQGKLNHACC